MRDAREPIDCQSIGLTEIYDLVLGEDDARARPVPELDSIREHVEACPQCRLRVLDATRVARFVTMAFDEAEVPIAEDFEATLRSRIDRLEDARDEVASTATTRRPSTSRTRQRRRTTRSSRRPTTRSAPRRSSTRRSAPAPGTTATRPAHTVTPLPTDPQRVREILDRPERDPNEPIRTNFSGYGGDPGRAVYWVPMAAAILFLIFGGGGTLYYLNNYEYEPPSSKGDGVADRPVEPDRQGPRTNGTTDGQPDPGHPGDRPEDPDRDPIDPDRPVDVARDPDPPRDHPAGDPDRPADPARDPADPDSPDDPGGREIVENPPPDPDPGPDRPEPVRTVASVLVRIENQKGGLRVYDADGTNGRPYLRGTPLAPDEVLAVEPGGMAQLRVVGGGKVLADGGTVFRLARHGEHHHVMVFRGRALFGTAPGERPFEVETPHARVETPEEQSPHFEISVAEQSTRLLTVEGEAVLEAGDHRVTVEAGRVSQATPTEVPGPPAAIDALAETDWVESLATDRVSVLEEAFVSRPWTATDGTATVEPAEVDGHQRAMLRLDGGVESPGLDLVEGQTYTVRARVRTDGPTARLGLALLGQPPTGPRWVARREAEVGPEWTEVRLRARLPLRLDPETAFRVGLDVDGTDAVLRVADVQVERLVLASRHEVDHDFHRAQPGGWQRVSGSWLIRGGRLLGRPGSGGSGLLVLPPTEAYLGDYAVGLTGSVEDRGSMGLAFRIEDHNNHYRFVRVQENGRAIHRLEVVERGRTRVLATTEATISDPATHCHLAIRTLEDSIEALVDGEVVLRAEDATFRRGKIGIVVLGRPARLTRVQVEDYR